MVDIEELITEVIDAGYNVHKNLAPGYLENVYHAALMYELELRGIDADSEVPLNVFYRGKNVGIFKADILIENRLILELKAVSQLTKAHETQLVNYLTTTGIDDGLLFNFGSEKFQSKRKYRLLTK